MKYNRDKHKRHSIRLKHYDYSQNVGYFLTICTSKKALFFEEYPELKRIVECEWAHIQNRYENIHIDDLLLCKIIYTA